MSSGWIKLHRKLSNHWVAENAIDLAVWVKLLMDANWDRRQLRDGSYLERGQVKISLASYALSIGVTYKQLRCSLKRLERGEMVGTKGASTGTVITLINYEKYQSLETDEGERRASDRANEGRTRGERGANEGPQNKKERTKEHKNGRREGTSKARPTSLDEVKEFIQENSLNVDPPTWWDHYESNGWKIGRNPMKDWRASVRRCHREGWAKSTNNIFQRRLLS